MDDDTNTPNMSDNRTSQVCIPNDRRPSDSRTPDTATTTNQSTIQSDYDVCVEFYERPCGCKKADGKQCSTLFLLEHFV